jgi:hypothetical protein
MQGRLIDQADFRLQINGDLNVEAVRAYWGVSLIRVCGSDFFLRKKGATF